MQQRYWRPSEPIFRWILPLRRVNFTNRMLKPNESRCAGSSRSTAAFYRELDKATRCQIFSLAQTCSDQPLTNYSYCTSDKDETSCLSRDWSPDCNSDRDKTNLESNDDPTLINQRLFVFDPPVYYHAVPNFRTVVSSLSPVIYWSLV